MNYRIFQNLTHQPGYAHCAREDAGYPAGDENTSALEVLLHRLRGWLSDINRKRRTRYENAMTIEHLRGMNDAQLRDIGISRPDIERAVRGGREQV